MISREKLIAAAARVYAEVGFRGATTRRIADAAGVNEITIFRLFGSKAALIDEALRSRTIDAQRQGEAALLPKVPVQPEREVAAWATAHLAHLRLNRVLIRKTMAELEERPAIAPSMCGGWCDAEQELRDYVRRLRRHGFLVDPSTDACGIKVDLDVAVAMLTSALFADAMGRDVMPKLFPQPVERAPLMYVRCFLRSLGCLQARRELATVATRGAARPRGARGVAVTTRRPSSRIHP
jgi:AcrR family transcriptional regulator